MATIEPAPVPEPTAVRGWKRAQLVLRPAGATVDTAAATGVSLAPAELRFAGPVQAGHPYRADDVFRCAKGHRRIEPTCTCGFYAVADPDQLQPSVVPTAVVEVSLEGRVVLHRTCMRGERQTVLRAVVDGWCAFCVRPAEGFAAIEPLFDELPLPWQRAVPVCAHEAAPIAIDRVTAAALLGAFGATLEWDTNGESPVAVSLRRLTRARRGAAL